MMLSDKAKKALLDLGLSSYEVKAYSTLVSYGSLSAIELSKISRIPYNKIYEVLSSLENKGFIKVEDKRPARYHAVDPKIAFEKLRKELEEKIKNNIDIALSELSYFFEKKGLREKSDVWLIKGKDEIIAKLKDMIARCKLEIFASIPKISESFISISAIVGALSLKNIKAYIIVSNDLSKEYVESLKSLANVRIAGKMFGGGMIADSREVLLLLPEEGEPAALWSDHIGLASFAKNYFMYLWETTAQA